MLDKKYWEERYTRQETGWDIGYVSIPIKEYIDQLTNKELKILIPGAGNGYEAEYLFKNGFSNTCVVDLAEQPLKNIKKRIPIFPDNQLIQGDFFDLNKQFDLVIEQTFFCAINPSLRGDYVAKMSEILTTGSKLVGLMFKVPLFTEHPPFGGSKDEYVSLFEDKFDIEIMEEATNSIEPRAGKELFVKLIRK